MRASGDARGASGALKLALAVTPQSQSCSCDGNGVGRGWPGGAQPQHPFPTAPGAEEEPDPHLLPQGSRKRRHAAARAFTAVIKGPALFYGAFRDEPEHSDAGLRPSPALTPRACAPPVMASLCPCCSVSQATAAVPTATASCQHKGLAVTSQITVTCGAGSSGRAEAPTTPPLDTTFDSVCSQFGTNHYIRGSSHGSP